LVSGASIVDIVSSRDGMGQLVEGGSASNITSVDSIATAERGGCDVVIEDIAVVDVRGRYNGVSDYTTTANGERVGAAQNPCARILIRDGVELGSNARSGVGSEIRPVKRIAGATATDVRSGDGSHGFAFRVAGGNERAFGGIRAGVSSALLEAEFAFGDVVGDGDGDGTGVGYVDARGIGDGLDDVVEPNDLERRHGVEGEGSWTGGREVEHGRNCREGGFSIDQSLDYDLESPPSCSAVTVPPAGMRTQSFSERSVMETEIYGISSVLRPLRVGSKYKP